VTTTEPYTPLQPLEERALFERAKAGDKRAEDEIVYRFRLLAEGAAARVARRGTASFDDALQEAMLGIMHALRKFDPSRGFRFQTYARWWAKAYTIRWLQKNRRIVNLPASRSVRVTQTRLGRALDSLIAENGEEPSVEALAERIGTDAKLADVERVLVYRRGYDAGGEMVDHVAAEVPAPDALCERYEELLHARDEVDQALSVLDERERRIIEQRFLTEEAALCEELAQELGISKQRVHQIQKRAFVKLHEFFWGAAAAAE